MADQDKEVAFGDNPSMLYTGSSSRMFRNEKLFEQNRKRREFEAKQAARPKGVRGIVNELQGLINAAKIENDSFTSYMRTMAGKGADIKPEDMLAEFRAREMNLALIGRIQVCLDKYQMPEPN